MTIRIANRNMFILNAIDEEEKCTEAQLDILLKINTGEYRLVKKNKRSSVWNVYREIARSDGTKLKWRYYCIGCKRVMQSTGGTTSNLRIHKCHVRYLKQNALNSDKSPSYKQATVHNAAPLAVRNQRSTIRRPTPSYVTQCQQLFEVAMDPLSQYSDAEDEIEGHLEEEIAVEQTLKSERDLESSNPRPLLKLFSDENLSIQAEPEEEIETVETIEQVPIELDLNDIQQTSSDFGHEAIETKPTECGIAFDASSLSEAESYAKAWAHAFLRLSEDQKFYAKRSIDELLVLGRLERLNISTVTSLTTNL
ncbi:uncharacterized protein LOC108108080 [Drosophila eugracilis]|uniref:uncharacterized protein LOC108108080 n=1 Tax=Drosophila eugracilis TaxID=29029 RepID=UPI0007E862B4|nr:uncharacterized protein LOC108108080 [Drosophila eugracilis]